MRYREDDTTLSSAVAHQPDESQSASVPREVRKGRRPTERRKTNEMDAAGVAAWLQELFPGKKYASLAIEYGIDGSKLQDVDEIRNLRMSAPDKQKLK